MLFANLLERVLGENNTITPRRASRFEEGEGPFEEAAPVIKFAEPSPRAAAEPERSSPPRAAVPKAQPPETPVADRLKGLPVPAEPPVPRPQFQPQTSAPVHEVTTAPTPLQVAGPRPAPAAAPAAPGTKREIHTEVRHERERERIRETLTERLTLEKRLETLRVETRQDRVIVESRPTGETRQAPVAPNARQPVDRAAVRPSTVIREVKTGTAAGTPIEPQLRAPAPAAPSVNVTIGRVEIRAVSPPAQRGGAASRGPKQSLAEYLRQREGA